MSRGSAILDHLRAVFGPHGIFVRGVVELGDDIDGPHLTDGRRARSVVLLGNVGGSLWEPFTRWRQEQADAGGADPLDNWSKAVIRPVAADLAATAWFPSDPPWQPFQRWAMQAEGLKPSPLGILVHPVYGLWHGYRGALGFAEVISDPAGISPASHPCDGCVAKPCLSTCPANAVSEKGFDVGMCRMHLATPAGQAGCMGDGCAARNACPVGARYRYPREQLRFHMAALKL